QSLTAEHIVNEWEESELSDLFYVLGEVKFPSRVVRAIINKRQEKTIQSTRELAQLIESTLGWRKKGKHPATQYFLALRLKVNEELEDIGDALPSLLSLLQPGGRIAIITFHSTEDRIVKN